MTSRDCKPAQQGRTSGNGSCCEALKTVLNLCILSQIYLNGFQLLLHGKSNASMHTRIHTGHHPAGQVCMFTTSRCETYSSTPLPESLTHSIPSSIASSLKN